MPGPAEISSSCLLPRRSQIHAQTRRNDWDSRFDIWSQLGGCFIPWFLFLSLDLREVWWLSVAWRGVLL